MDRGLWRQKIDGGKFSEPLTDSFDSWLPKKDGFDCMLLKYATEAAGVDKYPIGLDFQIKHSKLKDT